MYEEHNSINSYFSSPCTTFCDTENQDTCISYLSKELVSLGLSPLYNNGSNQCDKVKLINTIYSLLGHFSHERASHENLQDRIIRLSSDLDTQRCHHSRLQEQLDTSEKNAQTHQERHRQLAIKNKGLQADLKTEREECRRLQSILQQREAQYQHEQRRREKELSQLKERLHQTMSHKTTQLSPGMTLINGLVRQDGRRGTWTTKAVSTRNEDDLQKRIMAVYEQRNKLLLEENASLRNLITTLYTEFCAAKQECDDSATKDDVTSSNSPPPLDLLYKTAGGWSSDKVQTAVLNSWHGLKNKLCTTSNQDNCERLESCEKKLNGVALTISDAKIHGQKKDLKLARASPTEGLTQKGETIVK